MMIKTIIFDLGGVIVPEKRGYIEKEINKYLGIKHAPSFLKWLKLSAIKGEIKLLDAYSILIKKMGGKINPKELVQKHVELYKKTSTIRDSEIISLITKLKSKYLVIALTNTEIEIAELNKEIGLFDYFDKVYLSTELGLMKPQEDIYLKVLREIHCKPEEVVFIDDNEDYTKIAKDVGMNVIVYKNSEQLKKELSIILNLK